MVGFLDRLVGGKQKGLAEDDGQRRVGLERKEQAEPADTGPRAATTQRY